MGEKESDILTNIVKIRSVRGITKRRMAECLNINEASYGRLESGEVSLTINRLAEIASIFDMSVLDIITYPDTYEKAAAPSTAQHDEPVEAVLQIKLRREKREQVLKLVFGDNDIEILNK